VGERKARDYLRELGFDDAIRGQQYSGIEGRDVVCLEALPNIHFEVKYGYGSSATNHVGSGMLQEWWQQAAGDARENDRFPVVLWKPLRARHWRLTCQWYGILATVVDVEDVKTVLNAYGNAEGTWS
jgi:hypothetical protein